MIQDFKEALIGRLDELTIGVHLTDSEDEIQPTANSPIFQIKFAAEIPPEELQGFGDAGHFRYGLRFTGLFKTTTPGAEAHGELYRKWLTINPETNDAEGFKLALHQLSATGLSVGPFPCFVTLGETTPGPTPPGYTACIQVPITITTAFPGGS